MYKLKKMKKHIKVYFDYFNLTKDDVVLCEVDKRQAADIHHIKYKSRGGKDKIENLMALCRHCHNLAHAEILKEKELQEIHNNYINERN